MELRTFSVRSEFDTIPEEVWDRCSARLGMTFQYGLVQAMFGLGAFNVLTAFEGERLLGYVCAHVEREGGSVNTHPALTLTDPGYLRMDAAEAESRREELGAARAMLRNVLAPVLVVRNGLDSRVAVAPELGHEQARAVTAFLVDGLVEHARREGLASVAFARVRSDDPLLPAELESRGWSGCLISGGGSLDLTDCAGDFERYLKQLSSRRRRTIRHEIDVFQSQGLEVADAALPEFLESYVGLEAQNYQKYGHPISHSELLERRLAWYHGLSGRLGAVSCHREGRLVGGLLYSRGEGRVDVLSVGFDYDRIKDSFAYFNITFYWTIKYALAHGINTLDFGTEALKGKLLRGADLYPLRLVLDPRVSAESRVQDWLSLVERRNLDTPWAQALRAE